MDLFNLNRISNLTYIEVKNISHLMNTSQVGFRRRGSRIHINTSSMHPKDTEECINISTISLSLPVAVERWGNQS